MSGFRSTKNLALTAVLTAIVAVLQLMGAAIRFGNFSVSLVLIPLVIGGAIVGPLAGGWLGFIFSLIVLFTDSSAFLAINAPGTILTVLLKGTLAGLCSAYVYKWARKKYNEQLSTILAAITCPVINTGIFLIGCRLFFFDTIKSWALSFGYTDVYAYLFIGLVGFNFILELLANILLSPVIVRLINYQKGH